jgi:pyridoxine 4-dehydrogenase
MRSGSCSPTSPSPQPTEPNRNSSDDSGEPAVRRLQDETVGTVAIGDHEVRRLGFGAARVSGARDGYGRRDRELGRAICRRAYERGVNFFDVASVYGRGECEEIIAEALYPYPRDLLIASKAGLAAQRNEQGRTVTVPEGRPDFIRSECDRSLSRLKRERIDLYQIHTPDKSVPWAETVGAFRELRDAGKVGDVGLSNVTVAELEEARTIVPVVSVQNLYNVGTRSSDEVLETCDALGLVFIPYSPNLLGDSPAVAIARAIAAQHGVSAQQVNVAWLLYRFPHALPIPGTSQLAHLDDNVDAAWLHLSDADLARLDCGG